MAATRKKKSRQYDVASLFERPMPADFMADLLRQMQGPAPAPPTTWDRSSEMAAIPGIMGARTAGRAPMMPQPAGMGLAPRISQRRFPSGGGPGIAETIVRPSSRGPMPVGPMGLFAQSSAFSPPAGIPREMSYVSPWRSYIMGESQAPQVPSPEADRIAAQIMGEERARFAAEPRAPQMTQSPRGAWERAGQGYAPDILGARDVVGGQVPGLMTPTRLAPTAMEEPTAETPEERYARIMAGIEAGGLATNRMAGPGEMTPLAKYLRDVVAAQAGGGTMPTPFRGQPIDETERLRQGMGKPQPITREERLAKRKTEMDIRNRIAEGNRMGKPITRGQAQIQATIEGKLAKGEELTPYETISHLGPENAAIALQYSDRTLRAMEEVERMKALPGIVKAYVDKGIALPQDIRDQIAGKGPRQLAAEGGGISPPEEKRARERQKMIEAQGETAPTDAVAWERLQRSQPNPASEEEIDRMGRELFGDYDWEYRHLGWLEPRALIPGGPGWLMPKGLFTRPGRKQMGIRLPGLD